MKRLTLWMIALVALLAGTLFARYNGNLARLAARPPGSNQDLASGQPEPHGPHILHRPPGRTARHRQRDHSAGRQHKNDGRD
jgi:hypothetical protein